jgi:tripartite-type tricarboxylate transporter receptor subunit TctC
MLPDVPTVAESATGAQPLTGLAGFEAASWQGLFAPAGLPRDILTRLHAESLKALEAPEIRDFFGAQGFIVAGSSPEQFRTFIEAEVARWGRVVKAAKVTVD